MLDLAYPSLTHESPDVCVIGPVSDGPDAGYLWPYWIPWMAMLDREHLRLRRLDQVLTEGGAFVVPLELRWEFVDWFALGMATEFLTPHIPPAVLTSARAGKAILLLFFGHEARALDYTCSGEKRSAYDLILDFVRRHDLPQGAVWFISGNLAGQSEYEAWKHRRLGGANRPDPFVVRFVEPFSCLTQMLRRARDRGFDLTVERKSRTNSKGFYLHEETRLALIPMKHDAGAMMATAYRHGADALPPMLFLCMNRRPHPHRRIIVCHLLRRGFLKRSLVSFRDDHPGSIHYDDVAMEAAWQELQKLQPLTIDRELPLEFEAYHRGNAAAVKIGEFWPYHDSCFSIVTETHFCNDRLFVSEKLWKPILNGHPFVVAGTPGTLGYLRSLGFQTFAPMIDEHYDSLIDDGQRMQALLAVIDALGALDDKRRADMLRQMQPMLAHNARHLQQLRSPMAGVWFEIDSRLTA